MISMEAMEDCIQKIIRVTTTYNTSSEAYVLACLHSTLPKSYSFAFIDATTRLLHLHISYRFNDTYNSPEL